MHYYNIKGTGDLICEWICGEIRWNEGYLEMYRKQNCVDRKICE